MTNHNHTPDTTEDQITLRCSRCGKPITPQEAILTPTGYRCRDCVRRQQKTFTTNKPLDNVLGFVIAVVISFIGSLITSWIGFFTFLLAPAAGVAVAEVVRTVTKKRRGKLLFRLVALGVVLGALPILLVSLITLFVRVGEVGFNLFRLLPLGYQVLYIVMAVPSAYYRLSGSRRF